MRNEETLAAIPLLEGAAAGRPEKGEDPFATSARHQCWKGGGEVVEKEMDL